MPSFLERLDDFLVRYLAYFNYKDYVNRIKLNGTERVLEIGCGGGNLSRFLARSLPLGELVCIDISKYWINNAKRRLRNYKNIDFYCGDFLDFNSDNYFDVIMVHYVLHDIIERKKAIDIMTRKLKDKEKIFIREPTRKNHGISSKEIKLLITQSKSLEEFSKEVGSFPLRGKVYEGIFQKVPKLGSGATPKKY